MRRWLWLHMAFSLEMEMSMQAVAPSVSLPFWDYTIDATHASYANQMFGVDEVQHWRHGCGASKKALQPKMDDARALLLAIQGLRLLLQCA